jgi:hypothetical protein
VEHLKVKIWMERLEDRQSSKQVDYSLSKTREHKPKDKTDCNDRIPKWKSIQITRNIIMLSCKKWREIKSDKTWQITKNINKENQNSSIIILRLHQISISSSPSMVQANNRLRCLKTLSIKLEIQFTLMAFPALHIPPKRSALTWKIPLSNRHKTTFSKTLGYKAKKTDHTMEWSKNKLTRRLLRQDLHKCQELRNWRINQTNYNPSLRQCRWAIKACKCPNKMSNNTSKASKTSKTEHSFKAKTEVPCWVKQLPSSQIGDKTTDKGIRTRWFYRLDHKTASS